MTDERRRRRLKRGVPLLDKVVVETTTRRAARGPEPVAGPPGLPPGRAVELPGRGTTFVREAPGPAGAPTLVLLHGWTVTGGLNWFAAFPYLAARFRVLAIDHRGHGRGIRDHGHRFRLEDCADDVAALAEVLGIAEFVPVGYSMGGPVAQLVWQRHREHARGLVLCATSRNFRGHAVERALFGAMSGLAVAARLTPVAWHAAVHARMRGRKYDDTALGRWAQSEVQHNDPRTMVEAGQAIGAFNSRSWIGNVDVPTAVVVTEQDRIVPPYRQHGLAAAVPGASVHAVAGDHTACVTRPDAFVTALVQAIASVDDRAGAVADQL